MSQQFPELPIPGRDNSVGQGSEAGIRSFLEVSRESGGRVQAKRGDGKQKDPLSGP